jgi:hypothetical protein
MLFDPQKISWANKRSYVSITAHEVAHQWFGDLVTMVWWDDIWLNEGFATWLEQKLTAQFEPSWHEELSDIDLRAAALGADSIVTARRVREPIVTQDDIANVFDSITYLKGATVLNMFEAFVGPDKFQQGVRNYITERANGNATSTDFVAAISKAAGVDVSAGFSSFLDQAGAPEIELAVTCGKGKPRVDVAQRRTRLAGAGSVKSLDLSRVPRVRQGWQARRRMHAHVDGHDLDRARHEDVSSLGARQRQRTRHVPHALHARAGDGASRRGVVSADVDRTTRSVRGRRHGNRGCASADEEIGHNKAAREAAACTRALVRAAHARGR